MRTARWACKRRHSNASELTRHIRSTPGVPLRSGAKTKTAPLMLRCSLSSHPLVCERAQGAVHRAVQSSGITSPRRELSSPARVRLCWLGSGIMPQCAGGGKHARAACCHIVHSSLCRTTDWTRSCRWSTPWLTGRAVTLLLLWAAVVAGWWFDVGVVAPTPLVCRHRFDIVGIWREDEIICNTQSQRCV